jgi:hypothetical protein
MTPSQPVRVLLDEQLPRQLAPYLSGHDVRTTQQQGWAGLKNGELLRRAREDGFQVFATGDQRLRHQQNLHGTGLFVLVFKAVRNALEDLLPCVPDALAAIEKSRPGEIVDVRC